jgi:hypothetical protein
VEVKKEMCELKEGLVLLFAFFLIFLLSRLLSSSSIVNGTQSTMVCVSSTSSNNYSKEKEQFVSLYRDNMYRSFEVCY